MSVHIPDFDEDNAVPLFKLMDGVANSSAGLVCAKMGGVDQSIVERAKEILNVLKGGKCPVGPIPSNLNSNSVLQPSGKAALRFFLSVKSWADASDEDLKLLQQKIMRM
mmetsp:Transcript_1839/g.2645  ORF Transcript_1839/g.2645 Transcript_1839/m.2645 type:complete len:109 (+) Transcript_1839:1354-1680(+)